MQDFASYADELIEQIDAGELDPSEVDIRPFVEDDETVLTPELAERLPDDRIHEYNQRVADRDHRELQETQSDRAEEHEEALDALRDPDDEDTAEVEMGQTTLTVKTYLEEPIRRELRRLDKRREEEDAQRAILPRVMAWLVEAPEEYTEESLWEAYGEKYGFDELALVWFEAMLPKVDRIESNEAVRRFRGITEGATDTRGGD